MKAISKTGKEFGIRFTRPSLDTLKDMSNKDYFFNGTAVGEICVGGQWYPVTFDYRYRQSEPDKKLPVAVLGAEATEAFGLKWDWRKDRLFCLDRDFKDDYKAFVSEQTKAVEREADTYEFTQVRIMFYCHSIIICSWDGDNHCKEEPREVKKLAYFNSGVKELADVFSAAYECQPSFIFHRYQDLNRYDFFDGVYTVRKEDMPELRKIAAPVLLQRKLEQEREENIAAGAIYFKCESGPHNEDLDGVMLCRPCPKDGSFALTHNIDKADFARIKRYGVYYDSEFLEECDMFFSNPGWRFGIQAIRELAKDHRVFVDFKEVTEDELSK